MEFESIIDSIINKIDSLNNVNANNYDNKNDNAIKNAKNKDRYKRCYFSKKFRT